jgi:prevent-host-death family protein
MKTVGSRELKNRLGRYLKLVGKGKTLVITARGKPVAYLVPAEQGNDRRVSELEILKKLEREGHLRLGTRPFQTFKPIRVKGKPVSKIILEDRD